ncbi:MAG: hypothetical protein JWO64_1089 [Hyphomicrobiales bacterium]|jgi:hypothetical protein|nr:hypothetical protein [Hyphomicrobiales bacterium]
MSSSSLRVTVAAASLAAMLGFCADLQAQTNPLDPATLGGDGRITKRTAVSHPAPVNARAGGGAAGRYAPLREAGKDTGCMITLEAAGRAQLAPACRDQGLVVFDPVNWRLEQGRLALTARKGHKVYFERQADGSWLRDPKEGKALALRPI